MNRPAVAKNKYHKTNKPKRVTLSETTHIRKAKLINNFISMPVLRFHTPV
jgi:hypothetical protein